MGIKELMKETTPLPWRTEGDGKKMTALLGGPRGMTTRQLIAGSLICQSTKRDVANHALIAHCVNNFIPLLDALENMHRFLARIEGFLQKHEAWDDEEQDLLEVNEMALATAKEVKP